MWRLKDVLLKPVTCIYYGTDQQCLPRTIIKSLHWRHNDHDSVSNHQPHGCLLNRLFRRRSKKTSKLRVTGLCVGNSPGPVNSPHKGPVTRKMFPFDDVIMTIIYPYRLLTVGLIIFDRKVSRVSDDNVFGTVAYATMSVTEDTMFALDAMRLHLSCVIALNCTCGKHYKLATNHTVLKKWNYKKEHPGKETCRVAFRSIAGLGWYDILWWSQVILEIRMHGFSAIKRIHLKPPQIKFLRIRLTISRSVV